MQMKADIGPGKLPRYKSGHHHELVVVDPNRIIRVGMLHYLIGINIVDVLIRCPPLLIERWRVGALGKVNDIVENFPKEVVIKFSKLFKLALWWEHRNAVVLLEEVSNLLLFLFFRHVDARPADTLH